jgi:carbonic anhydrase/acetyltransferase-like protein (isoleucine patch superfamily)
MTDTFDFAFGGTRHAPARRWQNPDGSQGGIVAEDAIVDPTVVIANDAVICPGARIGGGSWIGQEVTVCRNVWIGPSTNIGRCSRIDPDSQVGAGSTIGSKVVIAHSCRIGDSVKIGYNSSVGERACIASLVVVGEGARISPDTIIERDDWWITIGPQGSRAAMVTAVWSPQHGLRWWVGCQCGISTDTLLALVKQTHPHGQHHDEYMWLVHAVENHPGLALAKSTMRESTPTVAP